MIEWALRVEMVEPMLLLLSRNLVNTLQRKKKSENTRGNSLQDNPP